MPADDESAPVVAFEGERRAALATGADVPRTPVAHARRIRTGRSTEPVWWLTGRGWSAAVKIVSRPDDALDWDAGARELEAHRSGLLASLPAGVRAPRCLALLPHGEHTTSMWLEGLDGPTAAHWPFHWYRACAVGVGQMQAAYVAGRPLPEGDWLNRGSIRAYVTSHPCTDDGDPVSAQLRCDDVVLEALGRLPVTLCHFDLHPRNLIVGDGDVVVLDWSSVGTGTLGEDPSTLVASAVLDGHVPPSRLWDLFEDVTLGYADGLRLGGLTVDDDALARAVGALLVVRLGWVVARRLARPDGERQEREAAETLAHALRELSHRAHRDPPLDVVLDGSGAAA